MPQQQLKRQGYGADANLVDQSTRIESYFSGVKTAANRPGADMVDEGS